MKPPASDFTESDKLVATYPASTQALISAARAALLTAFPKATESVDTKARLFGYSYGPGDKGTVATLILSKTGWRFQCSRRVFHAWRAVREGLSLTSRPQA